MQIGRKFESLFAKLFGGTEVPGSGNQPFRKMDIEGDSLLWSLKATKKESFRLNKKDLKEVYEAVRGPGGVGGSVIPGLAICFVEGEEPSTKDEIFAVIPMNDLVALFEDEAKIFENTKPKEKLKKTEIPTLFREKKK